MNTYIGIDLGTSAAKFLLVAEDGSIKATHTEEYPISYPKQGWSEQNPEDWFAAALKGITELLQNQDRSAVKGISFGGQMHGLVMLDERDAVIRPAILWNDGRTEEETAYLNEVVGRATLSALTANVAFAGFTAPKLLWVKKHEPELFARIAKIMLPKDYLAYRLCGRHCTDYSDASGMLLLDVKNRCWSREMCEICGVQPSWLPELCESYEVLGELQESLAKSWGLPAGVKVIAGAGDNAAAAVGTGTVGHGDCNISLGTSGTVFVSQDTFSVDANNALHSFAHANGKYHLMGCILSAASCSGWWMKVLQTQDFKAEESGADVYMGKNNVFFLPYLMGERSPHNDVFAKGAFIGLHPDTARKQLTLAVMEGVSFALRDCLEVAKQNGLVIPKTRVCGGGAKSKLWRKILANVCGIPVEVPAVEEGPSYGAAMLAMVGCGAYPSVQDAANALVHVREVILPDPELTAAYEERYRVFTRLYPALKEVSRLF